MGSQERRRELGCKQLTTQDHSQGCQLLGIVFFQSPAEVGGWRGQACHSVLHNAACIWIVTVFCGFSVCTPPPLPPPHLSNTIGRREARAFPPCWHWTRTQQAGMVVRRCNSDSFSILACPPTSYCLCYWSLSGAGKLGKWVSVCASGYRSK